ncbi:MAG: phytase [Rubrivivax sp.]|nr:phytase [Rubrivivax sp.]
MPVASPCVHPRRVPRAAGRLPQRLGAVAAGLLWPVLALGADPLALSTAQEVAPLAAGQRLELRKDALALVGPDGRTRALLSLRGKQLDARSSPQGNQAVLLDANTETVLRVAVDVGAAVMRPLPPVPATVGSIDALCLLRDRQQLLHAFIVGKEGLTQQWLLDGPQPRLLRQLGLPPGVNHCRVDDAQQRLFIAEPGVGVWAYDVSGEGLARRQAVALERPLGTLSGTPEGLAAWPGGVALLSHDGMQLQAWTPSAQRWRLTESRQARGAGWTAVQVMSNDKNEPQLWARDQGLKAWTPAPLPLSRRQPEREPPTAIVLPQVQTEPVARAGDAADDPAIWVHPSQPSLSRVLGTNKKQGLLVYDLQGRQKQLLEAGRLNNVDLRQGVTIDGQRLDIAVATRRDDNTLALFTIDAQGQVSDAGRVPTDLDEVYGVCVHAPAAGGLHVIVNDKDGRFQQVALSLKDGRFEGRVLRRFRVASQPEGCVADEASGQLFVGEEKRGVWVTGLDASQPAQLRLVLGVGATLKADVEGLAVYRSAQAAYLIVSSQGDDAYVVLDATAPFAVRGRFRIGIHAEAGIDAASETDGLDVSTANLGGPFARGILVVQDGFKRLPDQPQNFKYVAWDDIAQALGLR